MTVLLQIGRRPPDEPVTDASHARLFRSAGGAHLFVADGSRVYDLPDETAERVRTWLDGAGAMPEEIAPLMTGGPPRIDGRPLDPPPLASISLNVMQSCNMSCGYCYADEGRFGGRARAMPEEVAFATVDRLIAESAPGADLVVGFMGGEPLLARRLVHRVTRYADRAARAAGHTVRFAVTTNLTTVTPEDARLFAEFPFTVSVSLDGPAEHQDSVRRMRDGSSSYQRLRTGLDVLRRHGRPRHLSARVTVTSRSGPLLPILEHGIGLGFDEVGFSAVLVSPDPALALGPADMAPLLERMVACGEVALREIGAGRRYPFGNFETAVHQIHRGTHRPYPCGAGAGYLSANAEGDLYACHRLIDDHAYAMGDVTAGTDRTARARHLAASHVDRMEPCRSCWARYLCGGGCHHEVSRRGRVACDYIRGWLAFTLRAYAELLDTRPDYFTIDHPLDTGGLV
ncbi:radical SAM protein [Actinoplanes sp. NPDC023714]|uniref:radical SAM/SPASM domain-containing protein n=1 Tax=Actinoplanes sp. NPDC023714 TaxID=3154322 RepID=UPI0033CB567F